MLDSTKPTATEIAKSIADQRHWPTATILVTALAERFSKGHRI